MEKVSNDLSSINFDDLNSLLGSDDNLDFNLNTNYSDLSSLDPSNDVANFFGEDITDLSNTNDYSSDFDFNSLDLSNLAESNNSNTNNNSNQNNNSYEYVDLNKYFEQFNLENLNKQDNNLNNLPTVNTEQNPTIVYGETISKSPINFNTNTFSDPIDFGTHYVGTITLPGLPGEYNFNGQNNYYSINNTYGNQNKKTNFNDLIDFQKQMAQNYYNLALDQFNEKKREFDETLKLQQQLIDQKNQEIQLGWQYYNMAKEQWQTKLNEIQHLQQVRQINNNRFLNGD